MKLPNMLDAAKRNKDKVEYIYENRDYNKIYDNKKYFIRTYGCQMNVHDSEEISGILDNLGYTKTEEFKESDLIILNTCAIRENVHDK
ncbi:MAG: tRNA (N6-isopentenyl adenosine(37)-C2)-methylthiotransferase MiaB, partial [Bacilli bacterium]